MTDRSEDLDKEGKNIMRFQPNLKTSLGLLALGLLLSILPFRAWAFDLSPDASRVLSDPTYLPQGGQFFGSTEFSYNQVNSNTDNYQGKMTASTSVKTTTLTQVLDFGLTDDLTLRASGFYQLNGTDSQDPSGVSTLTSSYGMSDPTIALVCRVLDEKGAPFNWDLKASYTPDLINAESASADLSGSVARVDPRRLSARPSAIRARISPSTWWATAPIWTKRMC